MGKQKLISVKDFSPEELRKWQLKLLEILVYFRDFCENHNLRFYIAWGTLIGAVRHKGFIPWDDDVDVQMPREDYEKLIEIWNKEADVSKYICSVTTKDECSRFPMAVIRSKDTTCIYDYSVNDDICQGLKIDVEFFDVVPKNKIERKINDFLAKILALYRTQRLPKRQSFATTIISGFFLGICPTKKMRWLVSCLCEKQIKKYNPGGDDDYVRYYTCSSSPKSCYSDVKWVDFEGYKMPIPIGYDTILRNEFGDYMQFPPEESRKPATDNLIFYDLDHSYLNYKGKYYCVKNK